MENGFKQKIIGTLEPKASQLAKARGLELLRMSVRGTEHNPVIEVILDGSRSVTLEDCEAISRELNSQIDSGSLIKGNPRLDVLSPGTEGPITRDWQFQRNLGRLVEVHYDEGDEHHTIHGRLKGWDSDAIEIEPIHIKGKKRLAAKPAAKTVATDDGEVRLESDEQLYDEPVALVKVDRRYVTKVVVEVEFGENR